jgi:hypothetical protein
MIFFDFTTCFDEKIFARKYERKCQIIKRLVRYYFLQVTLTIFSEFFCLPTVAM